MRLGSLESTVRGINMFSNEPLPPTRCFRGGRLLGEHVKNDDK
jgi:hypothetical protein